MVKTLVGRDVKVRESVNQAYARRGMGHAEVNGQDVFKPNFTDSHFDIFKYGHHTLFPRS